MLMTGNRVPVLTGSQTTKTDNALYDLAAYGRKRLIIKMKNGGARRDRTDDLLLAKQALSQLSYGPV